MKLGVAYYRVSTTPQGEPDRNGLLIQKASVWAFARKNNIRIVKEFVELKSGGNNKRATIQEAIAFSKKIGAVLLIDKQDRLSRSMFFIATLKENKVDYIAVDDPEADEFRCYIKAIFDQYELKKKSDRAKATAHALKLKGVKLGTNGKKLSRYYKRQRRIQDRKIGPLLRKLHRQGMTIRDIAAEFTRRRIKNLRGGCNWHISIIHGIMRRNRICNEKRKVN